MNRLALKAIAGSLAFVLAGSAMAASVQDVAERYRKLVLAVGQHDKDYVDAYYGPPALQEQVVREKRSLACGASQRPCPVIRWISESFRNVSSVGPCCMLRRNHIGLL